MQMYNLTEYSDNYLKTSGSFWRYCRDELNDNIANFESFISKIKITGNTLDVESKKVEIAVPLKNLSNFWRTLEIPLISCGINLILTWSTYCPTSSAIGKTKFAITHTKLYIPIVTLSNHDNAKLLERLKSGFKRTVNWNKYQSKVSTERKKTIFRFHN